MCTKKSKKDIGCCPENYRGRKGPAGQRGPRGLQGAAGPSWMGWSWAGESTFYKLGGGAATYVDFAEVIYPGTTVIPVPSVVAIASYSLGLTADYDVELYDVTSGLVVAQSLNLTNITDTVINTMTITPANWPASRSRLRLRIRNNSGSGPDKVALSSMTWEA